MKYDTNLTINLMHYYVRETIPSKNCSATNLFLNFDLLIPPLS